MRKRKVGNVTVGKPDARPQTPTHVAGVHEGNAKGRTEKEPGIHPEGDDRATATGRRSTGVNPRQHEPIDPSMPKITPA